MVLSASILCKAPLQWNFNTSHVMVLLLCSTSISFSFKISIHLMLWFYDVIERAITLYSKFQYISCYGSIFPVQISSIFLLLFQYISCYGSIKKFHYLWSRFIISIHLMLWFYLFAHLTTPSPYLFQYISCYGSMTIAYSSISVRFTFQYISCYGSIHIEFWLTGWLVYFNTSHVMVLCWLDRFMLFTIIQFQYISCYGSIILLPHSLSVGLEFQYISCYGSIK